MQLGSRQCTTAASLYSPPIGLRVVHRVEGDFRSRTRGLESNRRVFRKGAVASFRPYYVWKFGGFLCSNFFVVLLAL